MPLFRRIPKRGFSHATWDRIFHVVNVGDLEPLSRTATRSTPRRLKNAGLAKGPADGVRILGTGELTKKLTVKAHHFSKSAAEKIKAKGGTMEVIPPPKKPVTEQDEAAQRKREAASRRSRDPQRPEKSRSETFRTRHLSAEESLRRTAAASNREVTLAVTHARSATKQDLPWHGRQSSARSGRPGCVTIFKIKELRQKIFITLLFLAIYRIGFHIPLPMIDQIEHGPCDCAAPTKASSA